MAAFKLYPDPFDRQRNKTWHRMRAQANYRGEPWDLSFEDYKLFWPTEELWRQRGRGAEELCMTRLDPEGAWSRTNSVVLPRIDQARYKNALFWGTDPKIHLTRARMI
jgi:hypothetical protein